MKYIGLVCVIAYLTAVLVAWCNDTSIVDIIVNWLYS